MFDNVIPYLFVKNFQGEIAYKGKTTILEFYYISILGFAVSATGLIRFLLRDSKETSKLAFLDDRILQQIVFNSDSIHMGLHCKFFTQIYKTNILYRHNLNLS